VASFVATQALLAVHATSPYTKMHRFRETVYDHRGDGRGFSQIEDFGNQNMNTYECLVLRMESVRRELRSCLRSARMVTKWALALAGWMMLHQEGPGFVSELEIWHQILALVCA